MKKIFIFFTVVTLFTCKNEQKPKEDIDIHTAAPIEKTVGIAQAYQVLREKSGIDWTAKKAIGEGHHGAISIAGGRINMVDGNITTGDVELDMKNILVADIKNDAERSELETHLKSSDFFDTEKYPLGRFVISKVEKTNKNANFPYEVTGDLTLKDITKPIHFLSQITFEGDKFFVKSDKFIINRTLWGINFQSTLLGAVKDKVIKDEVALHVYLTAFNPSK
jgi:polyisoprenoid-binding protein YceI